MCSEAYSLARGEGSVKSEEYLVFFRTHRLSVCLQKPRRLWAGSRCWGSGVSLLTVSLPHHLAILCQVLEAQPQVDLPVTCRPRSGCQVVPGLGLGPRSSGCHPIPGAGTLCPACLRSHWPEVGLLHPSFSGLGSSLCILTLSPS